MLDTAGPGLAAGSPKTSEKIEKTNFMVVSVCCCKYTSPDYTCNAAQLSKAHRPGNHMKPEALKFRVSYQWLSSNPPKGVHPPTVLLNIRIPAFVWRVLQ